MELWMMYAFVAAILIACKDMIIKNLMNKYSYTEHLLHYYILTGIFIVILCIYKNKYNKEKIRLIFNNKDIIIYIILAGVSISVITPSEILSLKYVDNPGKSKAIINLNSIFIFIIGYYFYKNIEANLASLFGIIFTIIGIYLISL
jgi:drug/metabolite transporter (DMT)-like permease